MKRVKNPKTKSRAKAEADRAFSWAVRESCDWTCQFIDIETGDECGAYFLPPTTELQCSHIQSRKHNMTRFHASNATALCAAHHAYLESRPLTHAAFAKHLIGEEKHDEIILLSNQVANYRLDDFVSIMNHYWQQFDDMRVMRTNGWRGNIQLEHWKG